MNSVSWHRCRMFFSCVIITSLILGILGGFMWLDGQISYVRAMTPYSIAVGMLILALASFVAVKFNLSDNGPYSCENSHMFQGYSLYLNVIIIAASVQIVVGMVILATFLSFGARAVLAFVGSIAFWTALLTFIETMSCITHRR